MCIRDSSPSSPGAPLAEEHDDDAGEREEEEGREHVGPDVSLLRAGAERARLLVVKEHGHAPAARRRRRC
eukprot:1924939-Rhodomonas_salina.1